MGKATNPRPRGKPSAPRAIIAAKEPTGEASPMPTLTANDVQRRALEVRRAAARIFALRAKVEAYPGCGQIGRVVKVENHIRANEPVPAHAEMDLIEAAVWAHLEKIDAAENAAAVERQAKLMEERGVASAPAEGKATTRDGWQWLINKRRLSDQQKWAGERFANYYALAMRDSMSSSANDNGAGSSGGEDPVEARIKARAALEHVARHIIAATGQDRLSQLLTSVCGKGESLRSMVANDDRKAAILETDLKTALDMASAAFRGGPLDDIRRLRAAIADRAA